ncbi:hypothetical protein TrispH2_001774 [Trichoplax sp. H2]|nr:hypothetical protein TrispH2_001774 [Trichoplax sp. H2]|eukprot:RDD46047.1 hypothetical protein TrispH2_001774 [Trichoplax sp. H2]
MFDPDCYTANGKAGGGKTEANNMRSHYEHLVSREMDILQSAWTCVLVDYINYRGSSCSNCRIPLRSDINWHSHTDPQLVRESCGK